MFYVSPFQFVVYMALGGIKGLEMGRVELMY